MSPADTTHEAEMTEERNRRQLRWYGLAAFVVVALVVEGFPIEPSLALGLLVALVGYAGGPRRVMSGLVGEGRSKRVTREYRKAVLAGISRNLGAAQEYVEQAREETRKREAAEGHFDAFVEAAQETGMCIPMNDGGVKAAVMEEVVEAHELPEIDEQAVYPVTARHLYADEPTPQIEARTATVFTLEIDRTESMERRTTLQRAVDEIISSCTFRPPDDRATTILTAYRSFRVDNWEEQDIGAVFERDVGIDDDLIDEFLKDYSKRTVYDYLTRREEQAREFRDTLADLIRLGRVDGWSLHKDVIEEKVEQAKQELREANDKYSSYIVLSIELMNSSEDKYGAVEQFEQKFPLTVRWNGRTVAGDGYPSPKYLSMRVTYTGRSYESTEAFLEEEIEPLLPPKDEWEKPGFVAAMPFEAPEYEAYPPEAELLEMAENEFQREDMIKGNFRAMEMLTVGREAAAADIAVDEIQREIDIEELLRVIPVNVVAPELDREEKQLIKSRYGELRAKFPEVQTLFDWGAVSEEELAAALRELDEQDEASDDWNEAARQVLDGVRECAEASGITTLPDSTKAVKPA